MTKDLTIIVPAYNEEKNIEKTLQDLKKLGFPIIVVDDGSRDKTGEIARKLKVHVITHPKNKGYGAALKTGFKSARTPYLAFTDADLTYPPDKIPEMLNLLKKENLDMVWGNRFSGKINQMPLIRKFGNFFINFTLSLITGKRIRDSASGERVFRRDILPKLDLDSLTDDLHFTPALTKRLASRGLKFKEIPINYLMRGGSSKLRALEHGIKMMQVVLFEK